jgi:hypothetical protein
VESQQLFHPPNTWKPPARLYLAAEDPGLQVPGKLLAQRDS